MVDGGDRNHRTISCRIADGRVASIAGRRHGKNALGVEIVESGLFRAAGDGAAQAHADDFRAVLLAFLSRVDQTRTVSPTAIIAENFEHID